jgi:hypothetical protein
MLYKRLKILKHGMDQHNMIGKIRKALDLSLYKLKNINNTEKLFELAVSGNDGFQWALMRLKVLDRKSYVIALEWWLKRKK